MMFQLQTIIIAAGIAICFHFSRIVMTSRIGRELSTLRLICFGLATSLWLFLSAFFIFEPISQLPLLGASLTTWSMTALLMISSCKWPKSLAFAAGAVIALGNIFLLADRHGLYSFTTSVNEFAALLTNTKYQLPDKAEAATAATLPSRCISYVYFFLNVFVPASFIGRVIARSRELGRQESAHASIHSRSLHQIILVVSFGLSLIVAFVLSGGSGLSVGVFSGLIALAMSVAFRDMLQNLVAGLLLLWEKSIKIGDVVSFGDGRYGVVMNITLRYVVVRDRDDITTLIPHSELINMRIENWTWDDRTVRLKLDIGVAYGSSIDRVKEIMRNIPFDVPRVLESPIPNPLIMSMGESSIDFQLRFRIRDPEKGIRNVMGEVYEVLIRRFEEAGISIPFPQRVLHMADSDNESGLQPGRDKVGQ